ncbi:glycosyltransferase family 4 protein [Planctomycetota bacterium]
MYKKRAVITVVNSIHPTSIEFHEFVLYRAKTLAEEENYFLILGPVDKTFFDECVCLASSLNIKLIECGGSYCSFCRELIKITKHLKANNIPSLMHIHMGRSGAASVILNCLRPFGKVPVLMTSHTTFIPQAWKSALLMPINTLLSNDIVCVSNSAYNSLPGFVKSLKRNHVHVILNGANIDWIDQVLSDYSGNSVEQKSPQELNLINVGRLDAAKNQAWLIRLMSQLPEQIKLTLVGGGPLNDELKNLIKELKLSDRIRMTGLLPRKKVFMEMNDADLFVSTSVREGLPIAVIEAMAAKLPVLLSDIGSHREIKDKASLVQLLGFDFFLWTDYINYFANTSQQQRDIEGQKNKRAVIDYFSLQRMHKEYSELYGQLWQLQERAFSKKL